MKLRIKGNSIRLRLGQSEVRRLAIDGTIRESTAFGPSAEQRLEYAVCVSHEARDVDANFAHGRIVVRIPTIVMYHWANTDQVGISAVQRIRDDGELRILIEKDFQCVDAANGEPQEDAFPHPRFEAACLPATSIERSQ
jgi:hypothetical protein